MLRGKDELGVVSGGTTYIQSMKNCVSIITGNNGEQSNLNEPVV